MTKSLAAASPFDWEKLNPSHFFEEFVQKALERKVMSKEQAENIQLQILHLLSRQVKKYTEGKSSSVPRETAEKLAEGILYTVGFYLVSLQSTEKMIEELEAQPLEEIFFKGQEKIKEQVTISAGRLKILQKTAPDFNNIAYRDTIQNGLDPFFASYNLLYFPQEGEASIDYPLNIDKMDTSGIAYIDSYIQKLQLENNFCRYFNEEEINALLADFVENSEQYLINIFRLVLLNSIASVLLNRSPLCLELTKQDCEKLQLLLAGCGREQLQKKITQVANQIFKELDGNWQLRQYCSESAAGAVAELEDAVHRHTLDLFFVIVKERTAPLVFIDQKPMDDNLFRELTDEIRDCSLTGDKLSLIRKEVHSFEDLIGVLENECFFGEEYPKVFSSLGKWELALLTANCLQFGGDFDDEADDKEWQIQFKKYLDSADANTRLKIESIARQLINQNNF